MSFIENRIFIEILHRYPIENARQEDALPSKDVVALALANAKKGENVRRVLSPLTQLGGPLIDHSLTLVGFPRNALVSSLSPELKFI